MSTHERNPYDAIGVDPNATDDEIRRAYLIRVRVLHPDRFDPKLQPDEWAKANEMLRELNEAYGALSDRGPRARYDVSQDEVAPERGRHSSNGLPTTSDFELEVEERLERAQKEGRTSVVLHSKEVHESLNPCASANERRMHGCCDAMWHFYRKGFDKIIHTPPRRHGSSVKIQYRLPR